jgi:hypothetical protein
MADELERERGGDRFDERETARRATRRLGVLLRRSNAQRTPGDRE